MKTPPEPRAVWNERRGVFELRCVCGGVVDVSPSGLWKKTYRRSDGSLEQYELKDCGMRFISGAYRAQPRPDRD